MDNPQFITSANIDVPHGFCTRVGGVSTPPFDSLNLGLSTGDNPDKVNTNRERVLKAFNTSRDHVCALEQIHSATVVEAAASWYNVEADAAVTDNPELLLVISTADCLPILFHDPIRKVIAAAHAGWRGTVQDISKNVIDQMMKDFDSKAEEIKVAIGPSIQGACYQVGSEVKEAFDIQGFPPSVYHLDNEGRFRLDLIAANRFILKQAGVPKENIEATGHCTHCDKTLFYSHRRDALKRGSHWSVIRLGDV